MLGGGWLAATLSHAALSGSDPARSLDRALKAAGSPKVAKAGKVDFHACRVAYITMLFENGATLQEAQELARWTASEAEEWINRIAYLPL